MKSASEVARDILVEAGVGTFATTGSGWNI